MEPSDAAAASYVAVIEDDPVTREVMREILLDTGYAVTAWDGIRDIFDFIRQEPADLLIQDIRLGTGFSVWELLDYIDTLRPGHVPRVLLCSADSAFLRSHRDALEARSCAIVEKPFDLEKLLQAVKEELQS